MTCSNPTEDELAHIAEIAAFLPPEIEVPNNKVISAETAAKFIYWGSRSTADSYNIAACFSGLRLGYCIEPRLVRWKFGLLTPGSRRTDVCVQQTKAPSQAW